MQSKSFMTSAAAALLLVSSRATAQPEPSVPPAPPEPAACLAPEPAQAREIRPGMCIRSSIDANDPKDDNEVPYEDWQLRLEAGQTVQIDLDSIPRQPPAPAPPQQPPAEPAPAAQAQPSTDASLDPYGFDTFLELRQPPEFEDPIATNDDRPGSLNSRILFTATTAGNYVVRARPLIPDEGDYDLRVTAAAPPPTGATLAVGRTEVPLRPDSPASQTTPGFRSTLFAFDGSAGERVRFSAASPRPGLRLTLTDESNRRVRQVARDSDANATLIAILPRAGRFQLLVEASDPPEATVFTLDFERRTNVAVHDPRLIRVGEAVEGQLGLDSNAGLDPYGSGILLSFHELFVLPLRAGEIVTVTLESQTFDAVLDAGAMSLLGFAVAAANDDGGGGLNSRLVLRPLDSGTLYLRVRALDNGVGAFQLRVTPGIASPPLGARPPQP